MPLTLRWVGSVALLITAAGRVDLLSDGVGLGDITFGDVEDVTTFLLHEEDGHAQLLELLKQLENFRHNDRSQAQGGLVGHDDGGRADQNRRQGQHLLLATRQAAGE